MLNMLLNKENGMSITFLILPGGAPMSRVAVKYAVDIARYMIMKTKFIRVIPEEIDVACFIFQKSRGNKRSLHPEKEGANGKSRTSVTDITHKFKRR
jgi:hypothetical protein